MGWEHGSTLGMAGITRRRPSLDGTAPEASLPMAKPPMASAPMGSEGGPPESGNWEQVSLLDLAAAVAIAPTALPIPTAAAVSTATGSDPQTAAAAERPAGVAAACPTHLLILDTETTGLDPEQDHCIEVGAILFHVPSRAVLSQVSFLLPCESNPAEPINGISAAVSRLIQPWQAGLAYFRQLVEAADVIVAHNASFDRQWFGKGALAALPKPWLCSMEDLRWPAERQLRATPSVRDLALAYGVPVWAAHRALTDCIYLAQVFCRCDDLEALLVAGLEPRHLYRAQLPYEQRHRARQAGFRWNDPIAKAWTRRLSEREAAGLGFPVAPVDPLTGSPRGNPAGTPIDLPTDAAAA